MASGCQLYYSLVFLNFRQKDTGNDFVSYLTAALCREEIPIVETRRKATASDAKKAIKQSKVSILILSLRYGKSERCLNELVLIIKQIKTKEQIVIPVFYNLQPNDVEEMSGRFGEAFEKFARKFSDRKVKKWRAALRKAVNLGGRLVSHDVNEAEVVDQIVGDVTRSLSRYLCLRNHKGLIRIEKRVELVKFLLLDTESAGGDDIVVIVILGMGGSGKSTVVEHLFCQIGGRFDGCCIIKSISEEVIYKELSSLKDKSLGKVLIALDGVDKPGNLEFLIQQVAWIGGGSRIVVTTRDEDVIDTVAAKIDTVYQGPHKIRWKRYKVDGLDDQEAMEFLLVNIFDGNCPPGACVELLNKVIAYTQGNPHALQVLGRCLIQTKMENWGSMLDKLDRIANLEIQRKQESSFCQLPDEQKNIFLDIACFFEGESIDYTRAMLNACYSIDVTAAVRALVKKSLVTTDGNRLVVHGLHKAMAKEILRKQSRSEAGERSRLWNHEDVHHVLTNNTGSRSIEGIYLDICETREVYLHSDVFAKMSNLRFIKFHLSCCSKAYEEHCKVFANQNLECLPGELRLLHWHNYPLRSLPSKFNPENLVEIHLVRSNLKQLWDRRITKHLPNLKWMNLEHSHHLIRIPDLSETPELEKIVLEGCASLARMHSSIQHRKKLVVLNLKSCVNIKELPCLTELECLEILNLADCSKLTKLPKISQNLKKLFLDGTPMEQLPQSICNITNLTVLSLQNCSSLKMLPSWLCELKCLKELYLSGCLILESFPDMSEAMENLEILMLDGTAIKVVPKSRDMNNLMILSLSGCHLLKSLDGLCSFFSLQRLYLSRSKFCRIPADIKVLSQLKLLDVSSSKHLLVLPELPSHLEYLDAHNCTSLETVGIVAVSDWTCSMYTFANCPNLDLHKCITAQLMNPQGSAPAGICYPEHRIPQQFQNRSAGFSVSVELPSDLCNSKFRGFSLAAVISFKDLRKHTSLTVECTCKLRSKNGNGIPIEHGFSVWSDRQPVHSNNSRIFASDHVFLGCNLGSGIGRSLVDQFHLCCVTIASFEFYAVDGLGKVLEENCKVIECGVDF